MAVVNKPWKAITSNFVEWIVSIKIVSLPLK